MLITQLFNCEFLPIGERVRSLDGNVSVLLAPPTCQVPGKPAPILVAYFHEIILPDGTCLQVCCVAALGSICAIYSSFMLVCPN